MTVARCHSANNALIANKALMVSLSNHEGVTIRRTIDDLILRQAQDEVAGCFGTPAGMHDWPCGLLDTLMVSLSNHEGGGNDSPATALILRQAQDEVAFSAGRAA
jgi:hypothetical protein